MDAIQFVENELVKKKEIPDFKAGDTVSVDYQIKEGDKVRTQTFKGVVIQRRGQGASETFTVRKVSSGIGVERIFPLHSPFVEAIKIDKKGSVRRAKIFYLRDRTGKAARIKEKRMSAGDAEAFEKMQLEKKKKAEEAQAKKEESKAQQQEESKAKAQQKKAEKPSETGAKDQKPAPEKNEKKEAKKEKDVPKAEKKEEAPKKEEKKSEEKKDDKKEG